MCMDGISQISATVELKGLIASIDYSRYRYENITLDGEYKRGGFNGKVALDDPEWFRLSEQGCQCHFQSSYLQFSGGSTQGASA